MKFGAHVSISGHIHLAVDRAVAVGCGCLQIFVGNPRQWRRIEYADADIRKILGDVRVIAMVGASPSWNRPSHFAMKYLQAKGYRVIPVNPAAAGQAILGEKVYATLADVPDRVDMVDIFRNSEAAGPLTDEESRNDLRPNFLGRIQPYSVYVPRKAPARQRKPLTWVLHSLGVNHNQYAAFDPRLVPGVGSPEPDGLGTWEVIEGLRALARAPGLLALEIVEYNPDRDRGGVTADLIADLIAAVAPPGRARG